MGNVIPDIFGQEQYIENINKLKGKQKAGMCIIILYMKEPMYMKSLYVPTGKGLGASDDMAKQSCCNLATPWEGKAGLFRPH